MSAQRWAQLDRIFAEARQLPAAEQMAFVSNACAGDAALFAEAVSLVSASNLSGDFMAMPALDRLAQLFAADGSKLEAGMRFGVYTILRQLGTGGAGEVWRARDERLGRDVAIKVLLPHLSTDTDKLRRFAEEARAVGALNHPNILIVHDVGEHDGMPFLVSECLEGRNLRERLNAGPIPVAEATAIAMGIARGLAAAHERSIIHRDLKPENTFLKTDGGVKLLDFGLAKLRAPAEGPAVEAGHTAVGNLAGTAGYMAPEQIRGEPADPRSDLFALGIMLYEMLAGRHPFRGASDFETLHTILTTEPPELAAANEQVSQMLARIVMRLLEKAPEARFQSARDLVWALEQWADGAPVQAPALARGRRQGGAKPWPAIAVAASFAMLLGAGWWLTREPVRGPAASQLTRNIWPLNGMQLASPPAVAPNGRRVALAAKATPAAASRQLYVRELGALEPHAIAGTEGAMHPCWSPDSEWIAFFARNRLWKVSPPHGAPVELATVRAPRDCTWTDSDSIVYGPDLILAGLSSISADGSNPEPIATLLETDQYDSSHWRPAAVPGGDHFLFFARSTAVASKGIYHGRVGEPGVPKGDRLFASDSEVRYAPLQDSDEDVLFNYLDGQLLMRKFDPVRLKVTSEARNVTFMTVGQNTLMNSMMLSVAPDTLVYVELAVPTGDMQLATFDLLSTETVAREPDAINQNGPRLSPNGQYLSRSRIDTTQTTQEIWVSDLVRGGAERVTRHIEPAVSSVWSPDSEKIAYVAGYLPGQDGPRKLRIIAPDGTLINTLDCPTTDYCEPTDWSPQGLLLVNVRAERERYDVWLVPTDSQFDPWPLFADPALDERDARFVPGASDWIAYVSVDGDSEHVYVREATSASIGRRISGDNGGDQPVWQRDGNRLYFVDRDGYLRSVTVDRSDDGTPSGFGPVQSHGVEIGFGHWGTQYDISADGRLIWFRQPSVDTHPTEIHVVQGWRELLD